MIVVEPDDDIDYKIIEVPPDPSVAHKIIVVDPTKPKQELLEKMPKP